MEQSENWGILSDGTDVALAGIGYLLKIRNVALLCGIGCLIGLVFELTYGGSVTAFLALPPFWFVTISIMTLVSYAVLFYLPFSLLFKRPELVMQDDKPAKESGGR